MERFARFESLSNFKFDFMIENVTIIHFQATGESPVNPGEIVNDLLTPCSPGYLYVLLCCYVFYL